MADQAATFSIEITSVGVPDTLTDVPVPIEIVSAKGKTRRALLVPRENGRTTEPVEQPGRYLIRTELPSGELLVETVTVPDPVLGRAGAVELDFGASTQPSVKSGDHWPRGSLFNVLDTRSTLEAFEPTGAPFAVAPSPDAFAVTDDATAASGASLVYGLLRGWKVGANTLLIERRGRSSVVLPGQLALVAHPGWSTNTREWRPLLVQIVLPPRKGEVPAETALVVWPPFRDNQPLLLELAQDRGINREAPPLLASSTSGDKLADALSAYIRGGRLSLARQAAPALAKYAEEGLMRKDVNPVQAIVAAYALLKVGVTDHSDWLANLANWFQYLPDGALLYGWYLIRAGRAPEAKEFFQKAMARGVPLYSAGVRLLRDGLSFLFGLEPGDGGLKADTARAFRLSAAVNPSSELTCMRLGDGLAVELA